MVMSLRKKLKAQQDAAQQAAPNVVPSIQPSQVPMPDSVASNGVGATRSMASLGEPGIDPNAVRFGREYTDWFTGRQQAGLGFLPVPQPIATFHEQRDPTTGDYKSRNFTFDYNGVPEPVANIMRLSEPELNRQAGGQLAQLNNIRQVVRTGMPLDAQKYKQPRIVQKFDPTTGNSTYELVESEQYRPFFGDPYFSF